MTKTAAEMLFAAKAIDESAITQLERLLVEQLTSYRLRRQSV